MAATFSALSLPTRDRQGELFEKLLTTGNPDVEADQQLLRDAGLRPAPPTH